MQLGSQIEGTWELRMTYFGMYYQIILFTEKIYGRKSGKGRYRSEKKGTIKEIIRQRPIDKGKRNK